MTALLLMVIVVLANHMGFVEAVEEFTHYKFKILGCSKCGTFWLSLIAMLVEGVPAVMSVCAAYVLAYTALWLELLLAIMAQFYETYNDHIQAASAGADEAIAEN